MGRLTIGLHHHLSSQAPDLQALRVKEDIKVVLSIARVEILVQTKVHPEKESVQAKAGQVRGWSKANKDEKTEGRWITRLVGS